MKNDFLEYYSEHNISPGQDISDIKIHFERRKKLYRQCGIPEIAFRNAEILEVGPGGGYNTLAFFHWDSKHVDLVEANQRGIEDMVKLFAEQKVSHDKYEVFPCMIEDYQTHKKYDIVIAEGFLPCLPNQQMIIKKLQDLVADNGIIVITCIDHVSCFIEMMKRLLGQILVKDIVSYEDKISYLSEIFRPQLAKLRGVSKPVKDWVEDNILNPAGSNKIELSMGEAIEFFGTGYDILGSSPRMFTDYSWHKDIWYEYKEDYEKQFRTKHLSLLMANMPEQILPERQAEILEQHFACIRKLAADYEREFNAQYISEILENMDAMEKELQVMDSNFVNVFSEIRKALLCVQDTGMVNMEEYPHFFAAFGRSQQYIAFAKK